MAGANTTSLDSIATLLTLNSPTVSMYGNYNINLNSISLSLSTNNLSTSQSSSGGVTLPSISLALSLSPTTEAFMLNMGSVSLGFTFKNISTSSVGSGSSTYTDNFSYPNGSVLTNVDANWSSATDYTIPATNIVTRTDYPGVNNNTGTNGNFIRYTPWHPDNQCSQVTWLYQAPNSDGPMVRMDAAHGTGYIATSHQIYRFDYSGSLNPVQLVVYSSDASANQPVKICAIGNTITAYVNGSQVATITDTTYTSGYTGIRLSQLPGSGGGIASAWIGSTN